MIMEILNKQYSKRTQVKSLETFAIVLHYTIKNTISLQIIVLKFKHRFKACLYFKMRG